MVDELLHGLSGPYAGGVRGGSDEPPFFSYVTLDDGLSSKDDGYCYRIIIRTSQGTGSSVAVWLGFGDLTLRVKECASGPGDGGIH